MLANVLNWLIAESLRKVKFPRSTDDFHRDVREGSIVAKWFGRRRRPATPVLRTRKFLAGGLLAAAGLIDNTGPLAQQ